MRKHINKIETKYKFTKNHETVKIKRNGEVFTPEFLVNEMLDKIPQEILLDCSKTVIDNCCGNGNFLWVVLQRRLLNGSGHKEALSTIYGVELDPANHKECQQRLLMGSTDPEIKNIINNNIVCGDGLTDHFNEFFIK